MNDQEEGKATNEETRGIVCVLYDVWEDGSEWVRGIEEEEEEEAELAEVLLIDCVICCCWKKRSSKYEVLSLVERSRYT